MGKGGIRPGSYSANRLGRSLGAHPAPAHFLWCLPGISQHFDDFGWIKAQEIDGEALERLPAVYSALQNASAPVTLAARRLSQTHLRASSDDITIDSCIGLEALLSKDTTELTPTQPQSRNLAGDSRARGLERPGCLRLGTECL